MSHESLNGAAGPSGPVEKDVRMQRDDHFEVAGEAESVAGEAEAVAGGAEAVAGGAEAVAGGAEAVAGQAEAVAGRAESVGGQAEAVAAEAEVVDGVPVLAEVRTLERVAPSSLPAVQAAAAAGAGFVAGAATIALVKRRAARKAARQVRGGPRRAADLLPIVATRSFLVDVHVIAKPGE